MATQRYSGVVRARVTYVEGNPLGHYRVCLVYLATKHTVIVGEPRVLSHAVDSPVAFDNAFRAAIAFAEDERERGLDIPSFYEKCVVSNSGEVSIARSTHEAGACLMDRYDLDKGTNVEGLSFREWLLASGYQSQQELAPKRLRDAWNAGEDPTEYRNGASK